MIVRPKVRGFFCVTAHPVGCAAHVQEQIDHVRRRGPIQNGPKRMLVIGASTGYGLASRIAAAFGSGAGTFGVFYDRPPAEDRPATPGWYNTIAFERAANAAGLYARSLNGDAFSEAIKQQAVELDPHRTWAGRSGCLQRGLAAPGPPENRRRAQVGAQTCRPAVHQQNRRYRSRHRVATSPSSRRQTRRSPTPWP